MTAAVNFLPDTPHKLPDTPKTTETKENPALETAGEARESKAPETSDSKTQEIRENRSISTLELAAKDVRMVIDQQRERSQTLTTKLNILFVTNGALLTSLIISRLLFFPSPFSIAEILGFLLNFTLLISAFLPRQVAVSPNLEDKKFLERYLVLSPEEYQLQMLVNLAETYNANRQRLEDVSLSLKYSAFVTWGIAIILLMHVVASYFVQLSWVELAKLKFMNSKPVDTIGSGEHLTLPEPDPDNITVLTRNLPNTPILPWNHYDSPWSDPEAETTESEADHSEPDTENLVQAENLEELDSVQASVSEGVELDGELDTAQIISAVKAEGELEMAQITSAVAAEGEPEMAQNITPEVTAEGEFNAQRLIALLDLPEETPTDELTG